MKDLKQKTSNNLRERRRTQLVFIKPSRVQKQFQQETDINAIMAKYQKTGEITHLTNKIARYADVSFQADYQTIQNAKIEVDNNFAMLPSKLRERFNNNPANLLGFLSVNENLEEAISLGLIDKKPMATPPEPSNEKSKKTPKTETPNSD